MTRAILMYHHPRNRPARCNAVVMKSHIDDKECAVPNNDALDGLKPRPLSMEEVDQIRKLAEQVRDSTRKHFQTELNYDEESIRWLDRFIEQMRSMPEDQWPIGPIGSFLGECIIRNFGGQWVRGGGMLGVAFDDRNVAFPYNKTAKQFTNGAEGGDAISGLYHTVSQLFHTAGKPLTPVQDKLLEFFQKGCRIFVFSDEEWKEVEEIDDRLLNEGRWLKLRKKSSVSYTTSMPLAQIDRFYACSSTGRLLHTERIQKPDLETLPAEILEQIKRAIPADTSSTVDQLERGKRFVEIDPDEDTAHYVRPVRALPEVEDALFKLRRNWMQWQQRADSFSVASMSIPRPPWMSQVKDDGLEELFRRQGLLLKEGKIMWAAVIQANTLLFEPGNDDCPGCFVYSPDTYFDSRPQELRSIGHKIFSFKETNPSDPKLKEVARRVTDEAAYTMGFTLPKVFSDKEIRWVTTIVCRKHIPDGVLSSGFYPILIHPSTRAVMIVPCQLWPAGLSALPVS